METKTLHELREGLKVFTDEVRKSGYNFVGVISDKDGHLFGGYCGLPHIMLSSIERMKHKILNSSDDLEDTHQS